MSSFDLIRMGLKNLWKRKLRTLLTILGVIIGTASIVIMVSLGIGMNESYKREIERMGSLNVIDVYPGYGDMSGGKGGQPGMPTPIDDDIIAKIKQIEGVEAVTPVLENYLKLVSGKYGAHVSIIGIDPETMEAFDFEVKEGRLLDASDTTSLVFGSMVPGFFQDMRARNRFYGGYGMNPEEAPVDVLNDRLELTFDYSYGERRGPQVPGQDNSKKPLVYKVKGVGILKDGTNQYDYSVIMNITELKKIIEENKRSQGGQRPSGNIYDQAQSGYQRVLVKAKDISMVQKIQEQILELGVTAHSLTDILESISKQSEGIRRVLGGIGAVSLLVAAIGITNTMVMAIYERTREIGVMKVIGASLSDIKRLFLFEAGMIGMLGGIFGLGFSYLASFLLNNSGFSLFGGMMPGGPDSVISIIPVWLALFAVFFTALVGLVSGFYPARRAMKLSALEAIRTE